MDHIADMITRIKNAQDVSKETIVLPYSKLKADIADVLEKAGYVTAVAKKGKKVVKTLELVLAYNEDGTPKVTGVDRVSKPSKRVYQGSKAIRPVLNGHGHIILSTPKGIMTGVQARKEKVGGEVLFKIW